MLTTVQKLEKVVKAVPRMEHFIHNVSLTMGEEDGRPLPLEKVLPLLSHWKAIVQHAQQQFAQQQQHQQLDILRR